jgi:hypothetical protein
MAYGCYVAYNAYLYSDFAGMCVTYDYIGILCSTYCLFTSGCYALHTASLHPDDMRYILQVYIRKLYSIYCIRLETNFIRYLLNEYCWVLCDIKLYFS